MKLEDLIVPSQNMAPKKKTDKTIRGGRRAITGYGVEEFNAKKFAAALIQCGLIQSQAYNEAFGYTKTAYQKSCTYAKRPEVVAAIREALAEWKEHIESGPGKANGILWNQVHANILDFFDDDGVLIIKDIKELPLGLQRCVKRLHIERTTTETGKVKEKIKVELYDKHEAFNLLGKIGKWFADNQEDDDSKVSIAAVIASVQHAEKLKAQLKESIVEGQFKEIEKE